ASDEFNLASQASEELEIRLGPPPKVA
nr:hypothetical protein [Phenylobacterium sp.]